MQRREAPAAVAGVAELGSEAVLVVVGPGPELLDRRRIALLDPGLPTHPHHHEGSWAVGRYLNTPGAHATSLAEALCLVERVRACALRRASEALAALAAEVPVPIAGIALRECAPLPPTVEETIADARAQTMADSILYRRALAEAAEAREWAVHWYDRDAVRAFRLPLSHPGPPWQAAHRLAAAAALLAVGQGREPAGARKRTV